MSVSTDLVGTLRRVLLTRDPPHHARIQPPRSAARYQTKIHPTSDAELTAHLAGRLTIANGDAHAGLEIQPAHNSRYGRSVAVGYARCCAFSLEQRVVVDAFAVYCRMEQLRPADAVRSLWGKMWAVAPPACSPSAAAARGMQLALNAGGGRS